MMERPGALARMLLTLAALAAVATGARSAHAADAPQGAAAKTSATMRGSTRRSGSRSRRCGSSAAARHISSGSTPQQPSERRMSSVWVTPMVPAGLGCLSGFDNGMRRSDIAAAGRPSLGACPMMEYLHRPVTAKIRRRRAAMRKENG